MRAAVERKIIVDRADNWSVTTDLGYPSVLVDYVYAMLFEHGDIKAARSAAGRILYNVFDVSPVLEAKYASA
jgi:hypothetical protein